MTTDAVASLSLSDAGSADFARALGESFATSGFAIVRDHGISLALIERAEAEAKAFFALPEATRRAYAAVGSGGARGYTPFGVETAKGLSAHDLKEFWHVGRELPAGHRYRDVMPDNVWPNEVPRFRATMLALFEAFDVAGARILAAVARFLSVDEDYFAETIRDGNSVLRLLHYPPVEAGAGASIRAGAHEDINAITLLLGAEEAGLELKTRDGRWLAVSPEPGELVVNIGDMLQRLTNGRLRSTSHRVVNPAPERASKARFSMPFFLHFRPDFLIEALPGTVADGEAPQWPPITSHDYLLERLREIKLA